jgi:hypothetical protein
LGVTKGRPATPVMNPELAEEYGVGIGTIWRALNPFEASASV